MLSTLGRPGGAHPISPSRRQATRCPSPTSTDTGTSARHRSDACAQRGANTQATCGATGSCTSPGIDFSRPPWTSSLDLAFQQRPGVGMARPGQHLGHRPGLDHGAAVHHAQVVAQLRHQAQVVRDEHDRPGELAPQAFEQVDDLGLDRRVQRRGGLVGEQQVGLHQQRHGDHHALAHAARELVRIGHQAQVGVGDAHADQGLACPRQRVRASDAGVAALEHIHQVRGHGEQRIERRHRVLEDHRDACAAPGGHRRLVEPEQLGAVEGDAAVEPRDVARQQAQQAAGQAGLARTGLAHHAQDAARPMSRLTPRRMCAVPRWVEASRRRSRMRTSGVGAATGARSAIVNAPARCAGRPRRAAPRRTA